MNFDLTDEHLQFRTAVERFAGPWSLAALRSIRSQPGGFDMTRWRALGELGLLALPAGEEHGGLGGNIIDCAVVAEAFGAALAPEPWLECCYLPLRLLERLGGELIGAIVAGEFRVALAWAEPNGRYTSAPKQTVAACPGHDCQLTGVKHVVFSGEAADAFLVTAMRDGAAEIFYVEPGHLDLRAFSLVDGSRAVTMELREAPARNLGGNDSVIKDAFAEARLIAAAEMVGLAGRLFDETVAYVRQREQFGQPIGRFQAIQHRLVDCYAMLEQMRSTLWRAAITARDMAPGWQVVTAGAKGFIAERALHIGHEAIQLHGGMGVTDELAIGHAHKRVLLLAHLFGDAATNIAEFASAA